jgi:hypothetical protein
MRRVYPGLSGEADLRRMAIAYAMLGIGRSRQVPLRRPGIPDDC